MTGRIRYLCTCLRHIGVPFLHVMGAATYKQSNSTAFHLSFAGRLTFPVRNRRLSQAKIDRQTKRNVLVMYNAI